MNQKLAKITLVRNPKYGWYTREESYNPDDELLILETYFCSGIGYNSATFPKIKKLILGGCIGHEPIGGEIIDGKCQLYHLYIDNLKEPRLTKEELLELIQKWFELVAAKVDKIVLTNDNGKYSIGTE